MKYGLAGKDAPTGLYRIRALRDIPRHGVEPGDLGGFVESEKNLSQDGDAWVYGGARVFDGAQVCGGAVIRQSRDYLCVGPIGSRDDYTTFFRTKEGVGVSCGCFYGAIEEFAGKVEKTHHSNQHGAEYRLAIALAKARMEAKA
jgi:hypothetical protein